MFFCRCTIPQPTIGGGGISDSQENTFLYATVTAVPDAVTISMPLFWPSTS